MSKQTDDEISLKEVVFSLKSWVLGLYSQRKFILIAGVVGASIGLIYSFIKKPVYTATLTFVLEDEKGRGGLTGALGLASQFGFDVGGGAGGAFTGTNLLELMKSRNIVEKTLLSTVTLNGKKTSLAEFYIQYKDLRDEWENNPKNIVLRFPPGADRRKFVLAQDSVLGVIYSDLIKNNVDITQKDRQSAIISISVKTEDELFSKYFAEALAKEVSEFYIETKSKKAKINLDILTKQTDSVKSALNDALVGVATANDNTFNLNPSQNINRVPSVRRQVDVQANTAILTELVKNMEMAKVTLRRETPLIQVIDKPILPLQKEKLRKIKGMFVGGLFGGLIIVILISIRRLWSKILAS